MSLNPKHRSGSRSSFHLSEIPETVFKSHKKRNLNSNDNFYKQILFRFRWKQLFILYLTIFTVIHYFERVKPSNIIKSCIWENWENWSNNNENIEINPHHSIIIGDPQIVDEFSYPTRNWIQLFLTKLFSDNYLHRNHNLYSQILNPDSIIFIGDLFDGGREWEDSIWLNEYIRFNKIFNPILGIKQFRQIPGNHDIGFGNGINFERYSRFKSFFGNADDVLLLGNHSIVLLDTVSMSCTDNLNINKLSNDFVKTFQNSNNPYKNYPRIVFSHVPLYRFTELQSCNSIRESKRNFPVARGEQYQTVLDYDMSQNILNWIKPIMIFSGDDHDYCHIRHPFGKNYSKDPKDYKFNKGDHPGKKYTDEITVKTSSMTGGIKKPAIQLLSMWNPINKQDENWIINNKDSLTIDSETAKTHLCYLPSPFQPLIHYTIILIIGIWWIFICTVQIGFGNSLNLKFSQYVNKIKKNIEKLFKKDIKSIDSDYLNIKNNNKFEKYFNSLLDWEIELQTDWKSFLINTFAYISLMFLTLIWYINSI
ncbi:hypothetical protein C6P40_000178 [Pichia californica]|uniref:Calcineurin-like phosphoesterase domain-containing protein n=1 Tax=Pichia californica TaxID=460514 RepID=A0A9P6WL13_9ASCO|nr:hypothetical protein C6P42_003664 [[Candida] californica]KAG0689076.1 hypothetical protein C6P40_000178 [[Candida] californica]